MGIGYLALLFVLLCSCRTPDGHSTQGDKCNKACEASTGSLAPTEANSAIAPSQSQAKVVFLRKMVGALSKEDPTIQHYDCPIFTSDLDNFEEIKATILGLEKVPIQEAFLFRATIPSMQYFAYLDGREILIFESYSSMKHRVPSDRSQNLPDHAAALMKIIDRQCPYPR